MKEKKYLHAISESISGEVEVYTEFIGNIATRQINICGSNVYSSSSLKDWNTEVGYLLYDGLLSDLDQSESKVIKQVVFESLWSDTINNKDIENYFHYQKGDASVPIGNSTLIIHVVNNLGKWGKGFVMSLTKHYPTIKDSYLEWHQTEPKMGNVQFVEINKDDRIFIGNLLAQNGIRKSYKDRNCYLDYVALEKSLNDVADFALANRLSVQAPKLGSGLAGGDWNIIQDLIKNTISYKKIPCYIIEFG